MAHPVPTAKTYLKTMLAARPAWSGVDIRDAQPTEQEDVTRDAFWFESTPIDLDNWAHLGPHNRRISFHLAFVIAVIREGDDPTVPEAAMFVLLDDMMAGIKADYSLGGVVQQLGELTGTQSNTPLPGMWHSAFSGSIGCLSKTY